jgi:hypothetical protein
MAISTFVSFKYGELERFFGHISSFWLPSGENFPQK